MKSKNGQITITALSGVLGLMVLIGGSSIYFTDRISAEVAPVEDDVFTLQIENRLQEEKIKDAAFDIADIKNDVEKIKTDTEIIKELIREISITNGINPFIIENRIINKASSTTNGIRR